MEGDTLEIGDGLVRVALRFLCLGRVGAEHCRDVEPDILEFDVRGREGADITPGAGERSPRRRMGLALTIDHLWGRVRWARNERVERVGPVCERSCRAARTIWVEVPQAV